MDALSDADRQAQVARAQAAQLDRLLQLAHEDKKNAIERIADDLERAGVSRRTARTPIEEQRIPKAVRTWPAQHGGLLLAGPPGTGKTTAAAWCIRRVRLKYLHAIEPEAGLGILPIELMALRTRAHELIQAIFEKSGSLLRRAAKTPLLAIDDWGATYEHEWPLGELDALVDARWEADLATIVTTNLHPLRRDGGEQSFEARYPRVWSRLLDAAGPGLVVLRGADLRRRGVR